MSFVRANPYQSDAPKKAAAKKPEEPKKLVIMEDWTLVRTKDKQCGWVLSRNLNISIPDEVAQYAEGKRITSYFDLGAIADEQKGVKHNWLWTTASEPEPYDFDGWRVFLWNRRHHRYETSYRQRDVEGYFPVHVDPADANTPERTFELITKDDDGKFRRRTYLFDGVRVHLTGTQDYPPENLLTAENSKSAPVLKIRPKSPQQSWLRRGLQQLKQHFSGSD
ncbi:MAG: hypothetical protein JOZ62_02950 [Acidobacteriaceae bacterium]|nr:hypothetical protein [Acidobacteriaceae bacterium]